MIFQVPEFSACRSLPAGPWPKPSGRQTTRGRLVDTRVVDPLVSEALFIPPGGDGLLWLFAQEIVQG